MFRFQPFYYKRVPFLQLQISGFYTENKITYQEQEHKSTLFPLDMNKTCKTSNETPTALKNVPYVYTLYKRAPNFKIKITVKCY